MKNSKGFSLIEVMLAMLILAIGVLLATSGQLSAMKKTNSSLYATAAMQLAEQQMELFQSMSSNDVKAIGTATDPNNPLDPDPNDQNPMAFVRRWIVTPDTPGPNVVTLEVQVDWVDGIGRTRTTSLMSLKAD